ncbi:MAG: SPASM domain-containing protein [Patescibacteria group bacterium]|jgi:radical SAM protein with 4Fe4S-binding SPASM domain
MKKDDLIYKELKTQENRLKYIDAALTGTIPEGFLPRRIFIEPTNGCNCRCIHCPTSTQMTRQRGLMDWDVYTQIIDELAPYWAEVTINLYKHGEPTLHPRIFDMLDYAHDKKFFVQMNTNLGRITSANIPRLLNVDSLVVSLNAANPETFRAIKGRDNFHRVLSTFLDYLEAWGEVATPASNACGTVFLRQTSNWDEAPLFEEMFSRLPIGNISVCTLHNFTGSISEGTKSLYDKSSTPRKQWPCCNLPWDSMGINWDGTALPCSVDFNNRYTLGNITEGGVLALWNNERMQAFRKSLQDRDYDEIEKLGPLCSTCSIMWEKDYWLPTNFYTEAGRMENFLSAAIHRVCDQEERHQELMRKWTYLRNNRNNWIEELTTRAEAIRSGKPT